MSPPRVAYNEIAGRNVERIAALSDGLFAIAMTLIVLEIRVPDTAGITTDQQLLDALVPLGPRFLTYLLSFLTLGIFWNGQQTQLNSMSRANRDFAWLSLGSSRRSRCSRSRRLCSPSSSTCAWRSASTG